jgi:GTP-binding protein HflX
VVARLRAREPHAVVVSARTGEGIGALLAAIEADLPRPEAEVHVLVPYDRGDLVARAHAAGEVLAEEHLATGTRLRARVGPALAEALSPYAITA